VFIYEKCNSIDYLWDIIGVYERMIYREVKE